MSAYQNSNHLTMKRMGNSFSKTRDFENKARKRKDNNSLINDNGVNINLSMDVKNYMLKQKRKLIKHRVSNTINFEQQESKGKERQNVFFTYSKKDVQGTNLRNVKLYHVGTPTAAKQNMSVYNSHKSIKDKKKKLSFSTGIRRDDSSVEQSGTNTPGGNLQLKVNQTVNIQKQVIIAKYEKAKELLRSQKYSQASVYLRQIIPHIQEKQKKKQLYFWFIACLVKSGVHNTRLETVENYIIECLEQFPHFYDVYLYWARIKAHLNQTQEAIEIYEKALALESNNSEVYLEIADIHLKGSRFDQALAILRVGLVKSTESISIPLKLIQNHGQLRLPLGGDEIKSCVQRIQKKHSKKSTQYLYTLGFLQKQKHNQNQALIYFLEGLNYNSNKSLTTKSLQNIIKIHISKRDFYAACHDLKRSKHLNVDPAKIHKYQIFLEGVSSVMKKQNQQGIKLLTKILDSKNTAHRKTVDTFFVVKNSQLEDPSSLQTQNQIFPLTIKYLAYAYFKLGNHKESIKCYKLLQKNKYQLDNVSKYNLLLAEGIILADFQHNFDSSIQKFQQAKIYLNKVEPWIYQAMAVIQRKVFLKNNNNKKNAKNQSLFQQQLNTSIIQALDLMQEGHNVNSSSSNLLYHRTILHLYFSSFKQAIQDINICIEKAEQNLPKYFYLRGICFSCTRNLKKAANQFSIAISLSKQYSLAYLQRAKCYFLSGQTQMGFHDLKVYMDQCPNDYHVHKWIGDLLFQGTSYNDCIKAYNQMQKNITLQALCMRMKAEIRVGTIKKISQTMSQIKSHKDFIQEQFKIDILAYNLLLNIVSLSPLNGAGQKQREKCHKLTQKNIQTLSGLLQAETCKGRIFNVVDCMNQIGIGSFYANKYSQAYDSFLLVLQFLKSTNIQNLQNSRTSLSQDENTQQQGSFKQKLNTQYEQQKLYLIEEDVYYNIFVCLLALKDFESIKKIVDQEMLSLVTSVTQRKVIQTVLAFIDDNLERQHLHSKGNSIHNSRQANFIVTPKLKSKGQNTNFVLQPRIDNPLNMNLKKVDISIILSKNTLTLKTSLIWSSYHGQNQNLYFSNMAKKLVNQLHTGYIDNMPEGPWIRRNQFGVLFTDNILEQANQNSFITTNRVNQQQKNKDHKNNYQTDNQCMGEQQHPRTGPEKQIQPEIGQSQNIEYRKRAFLKEMKLDLKIQSKLNKIIQKT